MLAGMMLAGSVQAAAPVIVKDINTAGNSFPENFTVLNNTLYFSAYDPTNGNELWKSDGTEAGTVLVKDIHPPGSSSPANLTVLNNTLYFTAYDATNGVELRKSDGTEAGTVLVKDIRTPGSSSPGNLTVLNNTLYFKADDGTNGLELWKLVPVALAQHTPLDEATGVDAANPILILTMTESVNAGATGNIVIKKVSDDSVAQTISINSSEVVVSGTMVTVTLATPLDPMTAYYINIDRTALVSGSNEYYDGMINKTDWNFTTGNASTAANVAVVGTSSTGGGSLSLWELLMGSSLLLWVMRRRYTSLLINPRGNA